MSAADRAVDPELLLAHADGLHALARRLLRDANLAEDVVQDAMLAAVRRPPPEGVPLGPWLVGIVRNLARMARRGDARRAVREHLAAPNRADEPAGAAVARAETHRRLVDAVLALAEPYRSAIVMRYLDGLSPSEIARRTGEPPATVRTRVHRGLALLRERLDADARRDGRSWVAAFIALTRRPRLELGASAVVAACLVLCAAGVLTTRAMWPATVVSGTETAAATAEPSRREPDLRSRTGRQASSQRARVDATDASAATEVAEPSAADSQVAAPPSAPAGVSVEIVDDDGNHVHDGVVKLESANVLQLADFGVEKYARHANRLGETQIGAVNPLVIADLPGDLDGLEVAASARVPGLPPTARATFVLHAGSVESVRLVATRPRSAVVRVVDRTTGVPVAGASVISTTELERRGTAAAAARGTTGPGAAVTADDGSCSLGGLGGGEHRIVVEHTGHARAASTWTGGEVLVRLEPRGADGTVVVTVTGHDGRPFEGIGVELYDTDRVVKTDAAGRAVFDAVAPGFVSVSLDTGQWFEALRAGQWKELGDVSRNVVLDPGRTCEIALGFVRAASAIDGRVVGEDGTPAAGVVVKLLGMSTPMQADATTDADGRMRFDRLTGGRYMARIAAPDGEEWFVGGVDVSADAHIERTWTLGANTVRGRVVSRPDHQPVAGVDVYAIGPREVAATSGLGAFRFAKARTGPGGRFEFRHVRTGAFEFSARKDDSGARRAGAAVPRDEEVVLELVRYGHIVVRFAKEDRESLLTAKLGLLTADGENAGGLADADGGESLVSDGLVPGRYEIEVSLGERTRRFSVEVRSGETSVVEITAP